MPVTDAEKALNASKRCYTRIHRPPFLTAAATRYLTDRKFHNWCLRDYNDLSQYCQILRELGVHGTMYASENT